MPVGFFRLLSLLLSGLRSKGKMHQLRRLPAEVRVEQQMLGRARDPLFAAKDVRDLHQMVVDDVCEVVGRHPVRLDQHLHVDAGVLELDRPPAKILYDARSLARNDHAHDVRLARGFPARDLLRRIGAAQAVVARRLVGGALGDAHLIQTLRRAEAFKGVTRRKQLLDVLAINRGALALTIRAVRAADVRAFIPIEPAPAQRLQDRPLALAGAARSIGILDAQDELAAVAGARNSS